MSDNDLLDALRRNDPIARATLKQRYLAYREAGGDEDAMRWAWELLKTLDALDVWSALFPTRWRHSSYCVGAPVLLAREGGRLRAVGKGLKRRRRKR